MRFSLVDRIVHLEPGARIKTVKTLSLAEEYLADHFPRFPVMPGVLMLEALTQSGAWLIRVSEDFSHSIITLKQARNVRFRNFVAPGQVLTMSAEIAKHDAEETHLEVEGLVASGVAVNGRLVLERRNLVDQRPDMAGTDDYIKQSLRGLLAVLYSPNSFDAASQNGMPGVRGMNTLTE